MAWIGVDLDGTLAYYDGWHGPEHIGAPVPAMLERVKGWLRDRPEVEIRIFTARICRDREAMTALIQDWLEAHGLPRLNVTNVKDFEMLELWDDRAVQVLPNTGEPVIEVRRRHEIPDGAKAFFILNPLPLRRSEFDR